MSYYGCVCRWPHVAVFVAFFSIQMCGDVLSQMCTQATTCGNMCFYQYSNVYWCYLFVALHEANMCAVFPKSKCGDLVSCCITLSNHRCCFSSVQLCVDVISCCITLKQSCVLFFQCPKGWWCHILMHYIEAIMCTVFPESKCVVMSYLVVLYWVIIWCIVFSVHKCMVMPNLFCIALSNYMHCFSQCLNVYGFSYLVACTTPSNHGVCFHNVLRGCCMQRSCWSWFSSE